MNNTAREYKMRAECQSDADLIRACLAPWLQRWQVFECHLEHEGKPFRIPDVDIEFTVATGGPTKGELKWLVNNIEDCHVAAESLDGTAEYTGRRFALEDSDCVVQAPERAKLTKALENFKRYRAILGLQSERLAEASASLGAAVALATSSACAKRKMTVRGAGRKAVKR